MRPLRYETFSFQLKLLVDGQNANTIFSLCKTNTPIKVQNRLTDAEMWFLDYHNGPTRDLEHLCTVAEYFSNMDGVEWCSAAWFAEI